MSPPPRLDPYAGLSKVNTPLQTPMTLSLEEWCTQPSSAKAQNYQLFALVMHSGVTISSGHYTAYIRVSDLKDVKLRLPDSEQPEEQEEKESKQAKDEPTDYDDGEVSFSLSARRSVSLASSKTGGKKLSEGGVGLLGGQRSLFSCDLGSTSSSSSTQTEKAASSILREGSKRRKINSALSQNPEAGLKKEPAAGEDASATSRGEAEDAEEQSLNNLLEYEGKWLLFDDCEVRLFEEEDFRRACSPETCSSSTPYLLFYRRMAEPGT